MYSLSSSSSSLLSQKRSPLRPRSAVTNNWNILFGEYDAEFPVTVYDPLDFLLEHGDEEAALGRKRARIHAVSSILFIHRMWIILTCQYEQNIKVYFEQHMFPIHKPHPPRPKASKARDSCASRRSSTPTGRRFPHPRMSTQTPAWAGTKPIF